MKNNKRIWIILIMVFISTLLSCGKEDTVVNSNLENINRAQYIGLIGSGFGYEEFISEKDLFTDVNSSNLYYAQIQACCEWGIIENLESFNPDNNVTLQYALETAVKAIGIDKIISSGKIIDEDNLVSFYFENIASIDTSDVNSEISVDMATSIIQSAIDFKNNLELPQVCEIELNNIVKQANGNIILNNDGVTGIINHVDEYHVGDIVYWDSTDLTTPIAVKITEIKDNNFTYTIPEIEEVYSSINVSGTYTGTILEATSASDGTIANYGHTLYNEVKDYGLSHTFIDNPDAILLSNGIKTEKGNDYVRFIATADASSSNGKTHGEFIAEITNIKVTLDYETENVVSVKSVYANVNFDTNVSSTITGEFSKSIPLGEVWVHVAGPIQLRFVVTANIGADGKISISYTTDNTLVAGWKKGSGLQHSFTSIPSFNFEAEATITAEVNALADLVVGFKIFGKNISKSMINAEVTTGLVAIGKKEGDLLSKEPMCTDVLVYVPLRWGINQQSCMLTSISSKLKYKATVWDSETSKFKLHLHFEDNIRTNDDICTRNEDKKIVQEEVNESGEPFDEFEIFDFHLIDFDFIKLESNVLFMGEKENSIVKISSMPDGYMMSDIVYEVEDTSVCQVNAGTIIATGIGSTIIKIKTSDGIYSTSLAVTVFENYSVDGFEPL